MQLPPAFKDSYLRFERYPRNLVHRPLYFGAIEACEKRFEAAVPNLLVDRDDEIEIKFRELHRSGRSDVSTLPTLLLADWS